MNPAVTQLVDDMLEECGTAAVGYLERFARLLVDQALYTTADRIQAGRSGARSADIAAYGVMLELAGLVDIDYDGALLEVRDLAQLAGVDLEAAP